MPIDVICANCDHRFPTSANHAGKLIACPSCHELVSIPKVRNPDAVAKSPSPGPAVRIETPLRDLSPPPPPSRSSLKWSLIWMFVGSFWATQMYQLWFLPGVVQIVFDLIPIAITVGLIGWSLKQAISTVAQTGRTLAALPLTCAQFWLFTLLFYQVARHLGCSHFEFESSGIWYPNQSAGEWLRFTIAHTFRAGDVVDLDVLQEPEFSIQGMSHTSSMLGIILILFHFIMDVFLLSIVLDFVGAIADAIRSTFKWALRIGMLVLILLPLVMVLIKEHFGAKAIWWAIDNTMRVVDIFDVMQLMHIRFSDPLSGDGWIATYMFRFGMGLLFVGLLSFVRRQLFMYCFKGVGLGYEDLNKVASQDTNPRMRQYATDRINKIRLSGTTKIRPIRTLLLSLAFGVVWFSILEMLHRPDSDSLARAAAKESDSTAHRALKEMQQLGPIVDPRLGTGLMDGVATQSAERRREVLRTLIAIQAQSVLADVLRGENESLALELLPLLDQNIDAGQIHLIGWGQASPSG